MASYETEEPVTYMVDGEIAWIMLARPDFGNAQNAQMLYALDGLFRRAADDDRVKVIILGGEGKHFSSGHDIGTPGRDADDPRDDRKSLWWDHSDKPGAEWAYVREQDIYQELCRRWRDLPKPTIAMIQGACIAGGLMLAWVCDLIVASDDAFFADPVLQMGVPGVEYFAHAFEMHPRIAREFLYLGERMTAERAFQLGMVNRIVPRDRLHHEAAAIAARLARLPRFGTALAKKLFNQTEDLLGKRAAIDAAFHAHHLAHAHNLLTTESLTAGVTARQISRSTAE